MENKVWKIIEKLFDSFPFQFLISGAIGGFVYYVTPNDASLLIKFGIFWYIVFISLISFLIIALIVWIYNVIKSNIKSRKNQEKQTDENFEKLRKQLYSVTDKWCENDINTLRKLVESNNEPIRLTGYHLGTDSLFTSNMLESKPGDVVASEFYKNSKKHQVSSESTIYWLKEDAYKICNAILIKYGKLSKFDNNKGEIDGKIR